MAAVSLVSYTAASGTVFATGAPTVAMPYSGTLLADMNVTVNGTLPDTVTLTGRAAEPCSLAGEVAFTAVLDATPVLFDGPPSLNGTESTNGTATYHLSGDVTNLYFGTFLDLAIDELGDALAQRVDRGGLVDTDSTIVEGVSVTFPRAPCLPASAFSATLAEALDRVDDAAWTPADAGAPVLSRGGDALSDGATLTFPDALTGLSPGEAYRVVVEATDVVEEPESTLASVTVANTTVVTPGTPAVTTVYRGLTIVNDTGRLYAELNSSLSLAVLPGCAPDTALVDLGSLLDTPPVVGNASVSESSSGATGGGVVRFGGDLLAQRLYGLRGSLSCVRTAVGNVTLPAPPVDDPRLEAASPGERQTGTLAVLSAADGVGATFPDPLTAPFTIRAGVGERIGSAAGVVRLVDFVSGLEVDAVAAEVVDDGAGISISVSDAGEGLELCLSYDASAVTGTGGAGVPGVSNDEAVDGDAAACVQTAGAPPPQPLDIQVVNLTERGEIVFGAGEAAGTVSIALLYGTRSDRLRHSLPITLVDLSTGLVVSTGTVAFDRAGARHLALATVTFSDVPLRAGLSSLYGVRAAPGWVTINGRRAVDDGFHTSTSGSGVAVGNSVWIQVRAACPDFEVPDADAVAGVTGAAHACSPCEAGHEFGPEVEADGDVLPHYLPRRCEACAGGRFRNATAAPDETCSACPGGTVSANETGSESCEGCPAGEQPDAAGVRCESCPSGTFSAAPGVSGGVSGGGGGVCEPCPNNTFAGGRGATGCANCPAGRHAPGGGASSCDECPAGKWGAGGGAGCEECGPGYFQPEAGRDACEPCPAGFFRDGPVAADDADDDVPDTAVSCAPCAPGKFSSGGNASCTDCPAGRYEPGFGRANECRECLAASEPGSVECPQCPAGTARKVNETTGIEDCVACEAGKFTSSPSADNCSVCEPGSFSESSAVACSPCPAGRFANGFGATACVPCPAATRSAEPATALVGASACVACELGTFAPDEGAGSCAPCAAGTYSPADERSRYACTLCPRGRAQPGTGASRCDECPAGAHAAREGQSACDDCVSGRFAPANGTEQCEACGAGTFAPDDGARECSGCPLGRANPRAEQRSCAVCAAGTFAADEGLSECDECPRGRFRGRAPASSEDDASAAANATGCHECAPGTFASGFGTTACAECQSGRFSEGGSVSVCSACPAGTFAPEPGADVCAACPPGSFAASSAEGASACAECQPGRFSPGGSASSCDACPPGTFAPSAGATACDDCPAGSHSRSENERDSCTPCAAGTASNETGRASECPQCVSPLVAQTSGLTVCGFCPYPSRGAGATCTPNRRAALWACYRADCGPRGRLGLDNDPAVYGSEEDSSVDCPDRAVCSTGVALPVAGFWVYYDNSGVPDVVQCAQTDICLSAGDSVDLAPARFDPDNRTLSNCELPHTGVKCGECAEGFYPAGFDCVRCEETKYGTLFALYVVVQLGMLVALCRFLRQAAVKQLRKYKEGAAKDVGELRLVDYSRIPITVIQTAAVASRLSTDYLVRAGAVFLFDVRVAISVLAGGESACLLKHQTHAENFMQGALLLGYMYVAAFVALAGDWCWRKLGAVCGGGQRGGRRGNDEGARTRAREEARLVDTAHQWAALGLFHSVGDAAIIPVAFLFIQLWESLSIGAASGLYLADASGTVRSQNAPGLVLGSDEHEEAAVSLGLALLVLLAHRVKVLHYAAKTLAPQIEAAEYGTNERREAIARFRALGGDAFERYRSMSMAWPLGELAAKILIVAFLVIVPFGWLWASLTMLGIVIAVVGKSPFASLREAVVASGMLVDGIVVILIVQASPSHTRPVDGYAAAVAVLGIAIPAVFVAASYGALAYGLRKEDSWLDKDTRGGSLFGARLPVWLLVMRPEGRPRAAAGGDNSDGEAHAPDLFPGDEIDPEQGTGDVSEIEMVVRRRHSYSDTSLPSDVSERTAKSGAGADEEDEKTPGERQIRNVDPELRARLPNAPELDDPRAERMSPPNMVGRLDNNSGAGAAADYEPEAGVQVENGNVAGVAADDSDDDMTSGVSDTESGRGSAASERWSSSDDDGDVDLEVEFLEPRTVERQDSAEDPSVEVYVRCDATSADKERFR